MGAKVKACTTLAVILCALLQLAVVAAPAAAQADAPPLVQGVGGAYLYSSTPDTLAAWYTAMLGISFNEGSFRGNRVFMRKFVRSDKKGDFTLFSIISPEGELSPNRNASRVNLLVGDIRAVVDRLRNNHFQVNDPDDFGFGWFVEMNDPEGNRLVLWQPK